MRDGTWKVWRGLGCDGMGFGMVDGVGGNEGGGLGSGGVRVGNGC